MQEYFYECVKESMEVKEKTFEKHKANLDKAVDKIYETLKTGCKILIFGNGGSAADSQHIAAEFVVRLKLDRKAYPAIAFTTDTSILTSCGNDFGFDRVFERQVEALGTPGDCAIALSTSGNSKNVLLAIKQAKKQKMKIIGFTGEGGGKMKNECDVLIDVQSKNTMRIQETHITFLHIICDIVEQKLAGKK
jgi:D-sedoheptulose 7-phosphate isomerase